MTSRPIQVPAANQTKVTVSQLFRQAKADLWAKEVQTGYTVTYAWMANQLGHFTLGFAPVILILAVLGTWTAPVSCLIVSILIFGWISWKEYGDFKAAKSDAQRSGLFPFNAKDVRDDAFTAVYFVSAGLAVGGTAAVSHDWKPVAMFLLWLAPGFPIARHWLSRKLCFQRANLPLMYRLANYPRKIVSPDPQEAADAIADFVSLRGPWRHLLIAGPPQTGKSTLGSAIGTEHAFGLGKARYFTVFDFLETADFPDEPPFDSARQQWPWRESDIVILDNIEFRGKNEDAMGGALPVTRAVGSLRDGKLLAAKRTVWLLGNPAATQDWIHALAGLLNCTAQEIGVIQLSPAPLVIKPASMAAKGIA